MLSVARDLGGQIAACAMRSPGNTEFAISTPTVVTSFVIASFCRLNDDIQSRLHRHNEK